MSGGRPGSRLLLAAVLAVAAGAAALVAFWPPAAPPLRVGGLAPDFELDLADGSGRLRSGGLRGRVLFVNFWATWCPPCRTEMPMMQRLADAYGDRLLILGVNFGEEPAAVRQFVDRYGIGYPILLDPTLDTFYRWSPQFGLPRHYFVDAGGTVVREVAGELPPEEMLVLLSELLGPPPQDP